MDLLANMRKGLASIALTALASTFMVAPVQAQSLGFTDDSEIPSWATEAIGELMDQGVIGGNDDGSFAPNRQLNRAEVSKIIVLATGIDIDTTGGPHFPDVDQSAWYYDYIETMYNQGWINGYPDGFFRPGVGINRAEIAKMVVNAFELDQDLAGAPHFDDVTSADWFYGYVETIYNNGCMRGYGDGTFGPANAVTRAETAQIVYCAQLVVLNPTGVAEGTLEVTLSNDTPRGTNIPYNATSVPFTTIELTASDDADVEISSLTFTRLGLGDNDDFDNVWLEIDGFKVGNDKSINNDDVVELRFNPPIVVPAGQTLVADVVASLDYQLAADGTCYASGAEGCNIGHHNRLALVSAEDIVSTAANIAGDFPIEGEEMEVADYRVSEIKFARLGSDTTVSVGDSYIEIGKFRMLNASTTNKDVELRAITFKNDGTAQLEDDLENVSLYVSGEQVSAETIIDGDYVTFRLDNGVTGGYILEDGDSRIFSIRADIVSAEKGDTINFKVDNFEDIVGVEIGTAFGVKAISGDSNGATFAGTTTTVDSGIACLDKSAEDNCARLRAYAIDAGDINISRDPASLGNQGYAPGSNDVVALTARVVVDQPVIVDGVRINVLQADNTIDATKLDSLDELNAHFDNFRLFLDDKLIDTENRFTGTFGPNGVGAYLNFNTSFEIAGTSVLKLVANIADGAATGSRLRLEVQNTAFESPEFISTGDQVSQTEIQGSAQASFVEVQESQLIITKSDGLSNGDRIVAGVNDVTFLKFVLDNNDSGDVTTSSVSIQAIGNGAATDYKNFTVAIFVDGVQQGSSRTLEADGSATFNDLAVVIPSAGQTEFEVVVDTIEASANANPANTVLVNGPAVASGGNLGSGTGAVAADCIATTIPAGASSFCVYGDVSATAPGAQVVISADATPTGGNAEIKTVDSVSYDSASGYSVVTVTTPFVNEHASQQAGIVVTQYNAQPGPSTFTVADASKIEAGDIVTIGGSTCTVTAVSGNTITCQEAIGAKPTGAAVIETTTGNNIRFVVTAVDADNVENGQQVAVIENTNSLGGTQSDLLDENATGNNENCDIDGVETNANLEGDTTDSSAANYLCGVRFALVQSGQLTVAQGATIVNDSNILVANAQDVEIFKLRLSASDDEIQVKDLFFTLTNAASGDRVDFKLYNEDGQLIQQKQSTGTTLHFELANNDRIRVPKDDSVVVTLKVDVRSITKANQTGNVLQVALSNAAGTANKGVEAVTVATGSDLPGGEISVTGTPTSEQYVIYRTMLTFANAAVQPQFTPAGTGSNQPIFRFTVTNDAAYEALLNKVTVNVTPSNGVTVNGNLRLVKYSSADYTGTPTVITTNAAGVFSGFSEEIDGTNYYEVQATDGYTDNISSDNDYITTTIATDTTPVAPAATAGGVGTPNNIIWSDRSNNGGAGAYLNGYELVLPSTSTGVRE